MGRGPESRWGALQELLYLKLPPQGISLNPLARALQGIKDERGVARDMARTKQTVRPDPRARVSTFEVPAPLPPPELSSAPKPPPPPKAEKDEPLRASWLRVWRAEGDQFVRPYWGKRWMVVESSRDGMTLRIRRKREPKQKHGQHKTKRVRFCLP